MGIFDFGNDSVYCNKSNSLILFVNHSKTLHFPDVKDWRSNLLLKFVISFRKTPEKEEISLTIFEYST